MRLRAAEFRQESLFFLESRAVSRIWERSGACWENSNWEGGYCWDWEEGQATLPSSSLEFWSSARMKDGAVVVLQHLDHAIFVFVCC